MISGAVRRLKALYLGLPPSVLRVAAPARFLMNLSRRHDLVLLEGAERIGGKPLSVVCTDTAALKDYLLRRAFRDGVRERPLGSAASWMTSAQVRALAPEADVLFWYVRPALAGLARGGVLARLPAWIPLHVDLSSPECLSRGKEKYSRSGSALRKAGFSTDISRGEEDFRFFHEKMFLPYVTSRHGENAVTSSLEETLTGLKRDGWELLLIRRGGEMLAGATVEFSGSNARFWQMGVLHGDAKLLAEGVSDAVYHHMLTTCRARGVKTLNLGSCRPFAQDGVLEYKRRFGAYVAKQASDGRGFFDLEVLRPSPGGIDFLAANPMIAVEPDGRHHFYGFARGNEEELRAQAGQWESRYCFNGSLDLRVFRLREDEIVEFDVKKTA